MNISENDCTHSKEAPAHWGPSYETWDCSEYPYEGVLVTREDWIYASTESTFKDCGLHKMKCTQCGKVKYYSEAARAWFEDGIPSDFLGLGGARG